MPIRNLNSITVGESSAIDVKEIAWNPDEGTFDMGLLNDVVLQAGQEIHFYGKAQGVISNGDAVMFAGAQGDHLLMTAATQAAINSNPEYFIGVATQDFVNNQFGYVTSFGKVRELDTTIYRNGDSSSEGKVLWFDSEGSTAGALTTVIPEAPNAKIRVAAVTRDHQNEGTIFVRPMVEPKLSQLQDVETSGVSSGDLLSWNDSSDRWENIVNVGDFATSAQGDLADNSVQLTGNQTIDGVKNFNGNVGIGTASPDAKLHVSGGDIKITDTFPVLILDGTTGGNEWAFLEVASGNLEIRVNNFPKVAIDSAGNVGIGTTTPSQKLDVNGNIKLSETAATTDTDKFAVLDSGVIKYRTGAEVLSDIGGQPSITNPVTGTGTTNYVSKWTGTNTQGNSLIFDNGTNVGIGTTTPGSKIDVIGSTMGLRVKKSDLSDVLRVYTQGSGVYVNNGNFHVEDSVGIGTTLPSDKLDVAGGLRFTQNVNFNSSLAGRIYKNSIHGLNLHGVEGTENDIALFTPIGRLKFVVPTGTDDVSLNPTHGNVGIGTTSPGEKLHVDGSVEIDRNIHLDRSSYITFYGDKAGLHSISSRNDTNSPDDDIRVNSYGAVYINLDSNDNNTSGASFNIGRHGGTGTISDSLFYVDGEGAGTVVEQGNLLVTDGNVGIGTTTPTEKLHVVGKIDLNDGSNRTIIGTSAGGTGAVQSAFGFNAGLGNTGAFQSAFGYRAGRLNTGANQSAFGYLAGRDNTGANQSAFGYFAGESNEGSNQSAFGHEAGRDNSGANQSAFGFDAGLSNTGNFQSAFGVNAGELNTGTSQSAFGFEAGRLNTGANQSAVGYFAGRDNIGGNQSAFGVFAGRLNSGANQAAFGYEAGLSNTGNFQSAFGVNAGELNTGENQSSFGFNAGLNNISDSQSVFGYEAGLSNTGGNQSAFGVYAGRDNTGNNQTAVGYAAGRNNTGKNNSNFGFEAGYYLSDNITINIGSSDSVFLGSNTKALGASQANQIVIGHDATGLGDNSVVLGNDGIITTALKGNVGIGTSTPSQKLHVVGKIDLNDGSDRTIIGTAAGGTGSFQSAFGYAAGYLNTGGNQSAFGYFAGRDNSGGNQSAFGYAAGYQNTGVNQSAFGFNAGRENTGNDQSAFGRSAGYLNSGSFQSAFGYVAGQSNTGASQSAFGYFAGRLNTGIYQSAVGVAAGQSNSGANQSAFGYQAGLNNIGANQSAFGVDAGRGNTGVAQSAVGYQSGYSNSGTYQSVFGNIAGYDNSGANQSAFGTFAGRLNTGSNQSALGYSAGGLNTGDNQSAVGYFAGYDNIGINQSVFGFEAGRDNEGDFNIAIGRESSYGNTGNNVLSIGYQAGKGNTQSNRTIIDNDLLPAFASYSAAAAAIPLSTSQSGMTFLYYNTTNNSIEGVRT